ncbi:MAG: hypothetical protein MZV63_21175 [Marinilabiliales bacterium]|nr:hypothetical protein [Marinilabiliales bacterium]
MLSSEMPELNVAGVHRIFFYGTGVSNATKAEILREATDRPASARRSSSLAVTSWELQDRSA